MNLHENTVFGRKVFFLFPPFDFQQIVIQKLAELEYEIYILNDFKFVKGILRQFPDSICFINIDTFMTPGEWFNYVKSFENDEILSTIFLGIMSNGMRKSDKELFLLHATIPAGFISTASGFNDLTDTFAAILDINGAKGRRKYVRADCLNRTDITAFYTNAGNTYKLLVQNISSVGFACILPSQYEKLFPVNTVLKDITINMKDKSIKCNVAVIISKNENNRLTLVFLFMKNMIYTSKKYIRNYIGECLQGYIEQLYKHIIPDETDYTCTQTAEGDNVEELNELEEVLPEDNQAFDEKDITLTNLF